MPRIRICCIQLWTLASGDWKDEDVASFRQGKIVVPTFPGMRPVYDIFLTQIARTMRWFYREEHFRTMARLGSSYAEVNGLAFPVPFETGSQGRIASSFLYVLPCARSVRDEPAEQGVL